MKKLDISITILSFNTLSLTRDCLRSLQGSTLNGYTMEIIVCDNASTDGTDRMVKKEFPDVIFIQNGGNMGFAAGNNPGIRKAEGRYILLLNSDTEVSKKAIASMVAFMDAHPRAGASTGKLLLPDGQMDPACHRGFPTPWVAFTYLTKLERLFPKTKLFGEYHQGYKNFTVPHQVDCISGAFFMIRRSVIDKIGGLDEDYFMYAEDIDWAYRLKEAGWEIWFNPEVTILHKKKQSGRASRNRARRVTTEIYFHEYNWLFFKKHYAKKSGLFVRFIVNTFYSLRILLLKTFSL